MKRTRAWHTARHTARARRWAPVALAITVFSSGCASLSPEPQDRLSGLRAAVDVPAVEPAVDPVVDPIEELTMRTGSSLLLESGAEILERFEPDTLGASVAGTLVHYRTEAGNVAAVSAARDYTAASGRACRELAGADGERIGQLVCRDPDDGWQLVAPLRPDEEAASPLLPSRSEPSDGRR